MLYQVFVQNQSNNGYAASIIGIPNCLAEGQTREEALTNVKRALTELLSRGEVVAIEVESGSNERKLVNDPWLNLIGRFEDDPTHDDLLANIAEYRRELDCEEAARDSLHPMPSCPTPATFK
jgi:predicted RNase H-like HicB family nuclease